MCTTDWRRCTYVQLTVRLAVRRIRNKSHISTRREDVQWRRQLWDTGARAPLDFQQFHFSSLWSKSDSQLSTCCVVCEIRWSDVNNSQLFRSVLHYSYIRLLVIKQLLHPGPFSQQILATPLMLWVCCGPFELLFRQFVVKRAVYSKSTTNPP